MSTTACTLCAELKVAERLVLKTVVADELAKRDLAPLMFGPDDDASFEAFQKSSRLAENAMRQRGLAVDALILIMQGLTCGCVKEA